MPGHAMDPPASQAQSSTDPAHDAAYAWAQDFQEFCNGLKDLLLHPDLSHTAKICRIDDFFHDTLHHPILQRVCQRLSLAMCVRSPQGNSAQAIPLDILNVLWEVFQADQELFSVIEKLKTLPIGTPDEEAKLTTSLATACCLSAQLADE
ncbi:hypothetical protein B0T14DRAFT_565642 [Immersiella caudata]|uniref:Uncharacterized protein n=1 Tax=Immersiella caudata TaxID=314043 RepID=A0AA39WZ95_9PEZI|nr:hypothetical protein B0T14DRAFT_565642 [Immersiella caudata]